METNIGGRSAPRRTRIGPFVHLILLHCLRADSSVPLHGGTRFWFGGELHDPCPSDCGYSVEFTPLSRQTEGASPMKIFLPGITYFYSVATLRASRRREQNRLVQARARSLAAGLGPIGRAAETKAFRRQDRRGRCRAACRKAPPGQDTHSPAMPTTWQCQRASR